MRGGELQAEKVGWDWKKSVLGRVRGSNLEQATGLEGRVMRWHLEEPCDVD